MKNLFKKTLLTAALMGAFSVVAMADEAQPVAVEAEVVSEGYQLQDPVATVNGKEVSKAELENFLLLSQGVEVDEVESPEVAVQLVKLLGTQDALAEEAKKRGLDKDEDYQLKMRLIGDLFLADLLFQNMLDKGEITQEELKAQYDAMVAQIEQTEYQASHILVDSEEEANGIIEDIKSGKTTFAEAAKEKSLDPATAARDGSIGGWFRLSMMDPSFGEALTTMEKGKMSETPVESQFGYHIIVLDDVRDLNLEIKPFDELDEETKLQLAQPLFQKYVEEVQEKVNVELPEAKQ